MTEPDDLLVQRVARGDRTAFECLFQHYYAQIYGVVYGVVGRAEEAEDLTQETFLELYRNPPRLEEGRRLAPWLCRVALNRAYNVLRDDRRAMQKLEQAGRLAPQPTPADPETELLRGEQHARIRDALAQLPERQNRLLLLRYAGLSYGEIAGVLGVARSSVGTLLARAARAFLQAYGSPDPADSPRSDHAQHGAGDGGDSGGSDRLAITNYEGDSGVLDVAGGHRQAGSSGHEHHEDSVQGAKS